MVDPKIQKAADLYLAFMEEIKTRLTVVKEIVERVRAEPSAPNIFLQAELAYLQLRFVCELTALAAIAAHTPWGLSDDLTESWNARLAFDDLFKTNPLCFPRPARVVREGGTIQLHIEEGQALRRRGFQRIYNKCGTALHRGILKHTLEGAQRTYDLVAVDRWARRIGSLLSHHAMINPEQGFALVANLTSGKGGSAEIAIALADGPAVYAPQSSETPAPPSPETPRGPRATRATTKHRK